LIVIITWTALLYVLFEIILAQFDMFPIDLIKMAVTMTMSTGH